MNLEDRMVLAKALQNLNEKLDQLRADVDSLQRKRNANPKRSRAKFSPEIRQARRRLKTAQARAAKEVGNEGSGTVRNPAVLSKLQQDVREAERHLKELEKYAYVHKQRST